MSLSTRIARCTAHFPNSWSCKTITRDVNCNCVQESPMFDPCASSNIETCGDVKIPYEFAQDNYERSMEIHIKRRARVATSTSAKVCHRTTVTVKPCNSFHPKYPAAIQLLSKVRRSFYKSCPRPHARNGTTSDNTSEPKNLQRHPSDRIWDLRQFSSWRLQTLHTLSFPMR